VSPFGPILDHDNTRNSVKRRIYFYVIKNV
jgi:hypothetical protein